MKGRAQAYLNNLFKTTQAATGGVGIKPSSAWLRNAFFFTIILATNKYKKIPEGPMASFTQCSTWP